MQIAAKFSKVSLTRFSADWKSLYPDLSDVMIEEMYNSVKLPCRATAGSAGYDFFTPLPFLLMPDEEITIPTGIRVQIEDGWVLTIYPRSGLGFKYRVQLSNTVGVIDSDYYYSDNEGHIFIKIVNATKAHKTVQLKAGDGFAQGIFLPFGITEDDVCDKKRNGGFGSTSV